MNWKYLIYSISGVLLTIFIGFLDFITGYQLSFSIFYLVPIVFQTWFVGLRSGLIMSLFGTLSWAFIDDLSGHRYDSQIILYWNATVRLGFFIIIVLALSHIKRALEKEHYLSRSDPMTGLDNRTGFNERLEFELERSVRTGHPIYLEYIDCDNFKPVNDRFGHQEGDNLLATIGFIIRNNIRAIDWGARVGGDEFSIILPDTDAKSSWEVLSRLQTKLNEAMDSRNWPVTFSIGLVTCLKPNASTMEIIREADKLMYSVKHSSKSNMKQITII